MSRKSTNSNNIESIIVAVILMIGVIGAMKLFSESQKKLSDPSHSIEAPIPAYQVSAYSDE